MKNTITVLDPAQTAIDVPLFEGEIEEVAENLVAGEYPAILNSVTGREIAGTLTVTESGFAHFLPFD